jgi:hypothetical protein
MIVITNTSSEEATGRFYVTGKIYNSTGEYPGDGFERAWVALIVYSPGLTHIHVNGWGIDYDYSGYYEFNVSAGEGFWDFGWRYQIKVDGTGWGDQNRSCISHTDPDVDSWIITEKVEEHDVNTVAAVETDNSNIDIDHKNRKNLPIMYYFILMGIIVAITAILAYALIKYLK